MVGIYDPTVSAVSTPSVIYSAVKLKPIIKDLQFNVRTFEVAFD